ncbi:hypothetical protein HID58_085835 [Brassica napus]|uniref:Sulfotransferase n=1 Tax=Brassica napus TaxID=3708 RepID=A0ABQ7XNR9_BRANA|nr:hypothetical protein HID58_085835 [Brassica napus]
MASEQQIFNGTQEESSNPPSQSMHELEALTDKTILSHQDEAKIASKEFENIQKRYQDLIAKLPHAEGWFEKAPFIGYGGHWIIEPLLAGCLHAQDFFQARPVDFFICSYPKSGTTWLKALAFSIVNRSRFDDSSNPLLKRNTLFSTHMPHGLLPESISNSCCKMVYIWRDPKDTFISMWTFFQKQKFGSGPLNSLEECFDMFCLGLSGYGPYLDHVMSYWKAYQENPNKILFLKYETMREDPLPYVKRLAEFMGYGFTAEEEEKWVVEKVVNLCSFETLKNLEANKGEKYREDIPLNAYQNSAYFRKGKVGDWQTYLTPEMAARIDGLMEEKFKGTGLLEHF